MKNPKQELMRHQMKVYHRKHQWSLRAGLFIPHTYPTPQKLSWWDDVGFILNGRRVMVYWLHPRCIYADTIEEMAWKAAGDLPDQDWPMDVGTKNWKKVGRSRKKLVSYGMPPAPESSRGYYDKLRAITAQLYDDGIDLAVTPSMKLKNHGWCLGVYLCAPIEVRDTIELAELAQLAERLVKREISVDQVFLGYCYERSDWLAEKDIRDLKNYQ